MIQITVTNSQEALQVPQSSCFPFAHHWLILVTGKHLFLTRGVTYPGSCCCSVRKKFPSLVVSMKVTYTVLEKGTRLFSKTARRRNVMLCCLPVSGQLLSTIEKYGGTSMAGTYYNSINNGVIRSRNRYTELTENHDDHYIGLTPRSGLSVSADKLPDCSHALSVRHQFFSKILRSAIAFIVWDQPPRWLA